MKLRANSKAAEKKASGQAAVGQRIKSQMILALAALFFFALTPAAQAAKSGPFKTLLGSWKGSGTYSLQDGTRERISCNAYYTGGGAQLRLAILCSSPGNKIHMRGKLSSSGGRLSGSWEERTYHAEGTLTGKVSPGKLKMAVSGVVKGTMMVSFKGRRQNVKINIKGTALKSVNVKLAR